MKYNSDSFDKKLQTLGLDLEQRKLLTGHIGYTSLAMLEECAKLMHGVLDERRKFELAVLLSTELTARLHVGQLTVAQAEKKTVKRSVQIVRDRLRSRVLELLGME